MGLGQIFLTLVRSAIFGLDLALENFILKSKIFQFFALQVKKISSSWVKKYPGQTRVGLLFTAGQKYAWVGLGPIPHRKMDKFLLFTSFQDFLYQLKKLVFIT